jgi:hypothetical protein
LISALLLGCALVLWGSRREERLAGVWQTADVGDLDMRPTIVFSRSGSFQFDVTGQGGVQRDAAPVRWELKDRAIWIIENGKRAKLADVAEVTATSLILCLADSGVQRFTRIGDCD